MNLDAYWVHDLSPFLFRFPEEWPLLGGLGIRYYGLSYLMGIGVAYLLMRWYHAKRRSPYDAVQVGDLLTLMVIGILAGGRIGYQLLYGWEDFVQRPLSVFYVWEGGMASHGGMVGVFLAIVYFVKSRRQSLLQVGDLIAVSSAPGLMFGRFANFINGELWGQPTQVPWAVVFPEAGPFPRHPSQLYEAACEGILLFAYLQLRFWGILGRVPPRGQLAGEFLVLYSIVRIFCEQFREPDASLLLGLSRGQFYSAFTLFAGVFLIIWARISRSGQAVNQADPLGGK
jgi:phosphatidylglycerol:prolipoprotein diacylglycerol transferase